MVKLYYYKHFVFILIAIASSSGYGFADGKKPYRPDSTKSSRLITGKNDKSYLKNGIHIVLPPLKASVVPYNNNKVSFTNFETDKALSNVQVYPNPITDQINLRYVVTKSSNVTIKILDVLGNEMIVLYSQRLEPGEQKFTYNFNSKLSSGFYFVKLVVGSDSFIKRISIL